jgi:leader peptidase (prepilin peptidase)/N-methyltransferase
MVFAGIFLFICTYTDIKDKCINVNICIVFGVIGLIYKYFCNSIGLMSVAMAILPGILLLMISIISKGSVGKGDAVVTGTMGLYVGGVKTILILSNGILILCIVGIICMLIMKKDKSYRIPFVPFLTIGFIYQIITRGVV